MKRCPCCSYSLLRHIRHNNVYWYCCHCRQPMPDFTSVNCDENYDLRSRKLMLRSKELQQIR